MSNDCQKKIVNDHGIDWGMGKCQKKREQLILINMEDEYNVNLNSCGIYMKQWQKRFCRKNSKYSMRITAKLFHEPNHEIFWKRYLILTVNGKQKEITAITPEAFDSLTRDDSFPRNEYPGNLFVTLFEFIPKTR